MARNIDLNPVSAIATGAIGQPGQRVFYLQARRGPTTITIVALGAYMWWRATHLA